MGFAASLCAGDLGSGSVGRTEIRLMVVEECLHGDDCAGDNSPCTTWEDNRSNISDFLKFDRFIAV